MRIVIALGGNALLRRGLPPGVAQQRSNVALAAAQMAKLASCKSGHELLITHGNGPQVGLLALQAEAYTAVPAYPLDVLGAQSQGWVGYLLEEGLANALPHRQVVTLLTRTEVSADDPAFARPTKPIGPVYDAAEGARIAAERGWTMGEERTGSRRLVASPAPVRVLNMASIRWLLSQGAVVIAAGGGGVPVVRLPDVSSENDDPMSGQQESLEAQGWRGIEGVIDKDATSALLAAELEADCLVLATDVPSLMLDWGLPTERALQRSTPSELEALHFAEGSMAPKVQAACAFVRATGQRAVIGALEDIEAMVRGQAGTQIVSTA